MSEVEHKKLAPHRLNKVQAVVSTIPKSSIILLWMILEKLTDRHCISEDTMLC